MRHILNYLLILSLCSICLSSLGQDSKLYLESNKTYSKGKIYIKKSLIPIMATKLTLVNEKSLNYTDEETGMEKSLNVEGSSINYVKLKTGTKAGSFALYGGLLMGLSAVYGVLTAEESSMDMYGETSDINWFPFIGGFTLGGAAVGALIGVFIPKYKNFYIKDNFGTYNFKIAPQYFKGGQTGIGVQVTF